METITKLDEYLEGNFSALSGDAYHAYADNLGLELDEVEDWAEDCENDFLGEFSDPEELIFRLVDEGVIDLSGMPDHLIHYFDYEKYARDFMIGDAWEMGGFYFWNR
jgi:antirestriction protein